ncbi:MAG: sugar phosphate isomerase/epimerase [Planctomycetes bacterium]|nr:sugar phosphate isomerase/epimerase [Planctomycetota bacterium]
MKTAILSDEISLDFDTAVEIGTSWGIQYYELRNTPSGRIPQCAESDIRKIADGVKRYDVKITGLSPGLFKCAVEDPQVQKDIEEVLPRVFELGEKFNTNKIVIFGFGKPGDDHHAKIACDGSKYPQAVIDRLGDMAARAEAAGMMLYLENEAVCWGDTGPNTGDIIRKVGSDHLKLNWDPCNARSCGVTPYPDGYEQVKDLVAHLHIKDLKTEDGKRQVCPVGEGDIDWRGQFKALRDDGYDGYYVIETHFRPKVAASKACHEALTRMLIEVV